MYDGVPPRVVDDDKDEITVTFSGKTLRGWEYHSEAERRQKMLQAREYVEGWCDGWDAHVEKLTPGDIS